MTFLSPSEQERIATLEHAIQSLRLDLDIAEQAIATQYETIAQHSKDITAIEMRLMELEP